MAHADITLLGDEAMQAFGATLAKAVPAPLIIYLRGDLGAGKTTLVRGVMRGLGYDGAVKSPTFTLMEPYELASRRVLHLDLYRMADPEELEYLGLRDYLSEPALFMIEWPEQGAGFLPAADLEIAITVQGTGRALRLAAFSEAGTRVLDELALPGTKINNIE